MTWCIDRLDLLDVIVLHTLSYIMLTSQIWLYYRCHCITCRPWMDQTKGSSMCGQKSPMCCQKRPMCCLFASSISLYGLAFISRIDKNIGLFCKRALEKRQYSAKETYNFIDPTDRSHPIIHLWHIPLWHIPLRKIHPQNPLIPTTRFLRYLSVQIQIWDFGLIEFVPRDSSFSIWWISGV